MGTNNLDRRYLTIRPGRHPAFLTALAYFVVGAASLVVSSALGGTLIVWPPAGIAIAAVALGGPSVALGVAVAAFALRAAVGAVLSDPSDLLHAWAASGAVAIAAAVQALYGAWLLRRTRAFPFARINARSVSLFLALGVFAGAFGASLVSFSFLALGRLTPSQLPLTLALRVCQEALGIIAVAPIVVIGLRAPDGERLRRMAPVAVAALLALAAATAVLAIEVRAENRALSAEIDDLTGDLARRIDNTLHLGANAVGGVAGLFETRADRNLEEFDSVAKRVLAFALGIQAIEWIPRVPSADRGTYEAAMRDQWAQPFSVFDRANGKPVPVAERSSYFPVGYVYPIQGNEGALGYDLASDGVRSAALIAAEHTGQPAATAPVKLVQNGAMGVLLFVPVFDARENSGPGSLKGFALGVFDVPTLLDVAFKGLDRSLMNYWVLDETDPGRTVVIHGNAAGSPEPFRRSYQISRTFGFGNPESRRPGCDRLRGAEMARLGGPDRGLSRWPCRRGPVPHFVRRRGPDRSRLRRRCWSRPIFSGSWWRIAKRRSETRSSRSTSTRSSASPTPPARSSTQTTNSAGRRAIHARRCWAEVTVS